MRFRLCALRVFSRLWSLQVSGGNRVSEEMMATVEFTNPFSFALAEVYLRMEGAGVMLPKYKYYR